MTRCKAVWDFAVNGEPVRRGETIDVPDDEARRLAGAGVAVIVSHLDNIEEAVEQPPENAARKVRRGR
jgi:hypothetical protein